MKTPIPDELVVRLIKESIIDLKEGGIVFNKFPGNANQTKMLETFLFVKRISRPIAILLESDLLCSLNRMLEKTKTIDYDAATKIYNQHEAKHKLIKEYYEYYALKFNTSNKTIEESNEEIIKTLKDKRLLA